MPSYKGACFARLVFAATHGQECGTVLVTGLGGKYM